MACACSSYFPIVQSQLVFDRCSPNVALRIQALVGGLMEEWGQSFAHAFSCAATIYIGVSLTVEESLYPVSKAFLFFSTWIISCELISFSGHMIRSAAALQADLSKITS